MFLKNKQSSNKVVVNMTLHKLGQGSRGRLFPISIHGKNEREHLSGKNKIAHRSADWSLSGEGPRLSPSFHVSHLSFSRFTVSIRGDRELQQCHRASAQRRGIFLFFVSAVPNELFEQGDINTS